MEDRLGRAIPVHPHVISAVKVLVVTPLFAATLLPFQLFHPRVDPLISVALFLAFLALDVLDGTVARARKIESRVGRVLDRVTDLPLLVVVAVAAIIVNAAPSELIVAKLALDGLAGVLSLLKGRPVDDRLRVSVSDVTTLALVILVQVPGVDGNSGSPFLNRDVVSAMLVVNIAFSAVVGLYNAGVLQKRFIADALSASNALCGVASIWFGMLRQPIAC